MRSCNEDIEREGIGTLRRTLIVQIGNMVVKNQLILQRKMINRQKIIG
jgi:hypothetical protein